MEKNHIVTAHGNVYRYDERNKQIVYLHPWVNACREWDQQGGGDPEVFIKAQAEKNGVSPQQWRKSYEKYLFLKSKGVFEQPEEEPQSLRLQGGHVKMQMANIKQVVFEVTDACNLKCKYCAYGEFYCDYDRRENKMLDLRAALNLLKYLETLWRSELDTSSHHKVTIGFYGGEPLVNFGFIRTIVEYTQELNIPGVSFSYAMTTNALLLDRYMDFIAKYEFMLLISLDGDREGNSYRVRPNGESSFEDVFRNARLLQEKYPAYFEKSVNFNSVIHNRNHPEEVYRFIKENFGKVPTMSALNNAGIRKDKVELFWKTYRDVQEDLMKSENYRVIRKDLFSKDPDTNGLTYFVHAHSNNVFRDYRLLFQDQKKWYYLPTGTCAPFSRKLFLTVNGKVLPCERVGQLHALGEVTAEKVDIDCDKIAALYNGMYDKIWTQCRRCTRREVCLQCIWQLDDPLNPVCHAFMNDRNFNGYMQKNLSLLEEEPVVYHRIMKEIVFE